MIARRPRSSNAASWLVSPNPKLYSVSTRARTPFGARSGWHLVNDRVFGRARETLAFGIVISYLVDHALASSEACRRMFALAVVPAAAFGIQPILIPDSPRWLVGRG